MRARAGSLALLLAILASTTASAHRRDEYLQAARIAIAPTRVELQLDLTPGIAVADTIIAEIDPNGDGLFSSDEQRAYVAQVMRALTLGVDDTLLQMQPISSSFPTADAIRRGEGTIQLQFDAILPPLAAGTHRLSYHNTHRRDVGVYLANALLPDTDRIAITAQLRDLDQRDLAIEYVFRDRSIRTWLLAAFFIAAVGAALLLHRLRKQDPQTSRLSSALATASEREWTCSLE
jgi:hypothetical protein